jgi:hypothetical protein
VGSVKKIVDLSQFINEPTNGTYTDLFPPHVMSGVDKLHAQGYKGEGIFIAIIDSGVDYTYDNYFSLHSSIHSINYIDTQH